MSTPTFSDIVSKYADKSIYDKLYRCYCEGIRKRNVIKKECVRYIVSFISCIDRDNLDGLKRELMEFNDCLCVDSDKDLNVNDICNIIDTFINIDNLPNHICCKYMRICDLIRMCVCRYLPYNDRKIMTNIYKHKFQLDISYCYDPEKIYKLWYFENMPLFDSALMYMTEKPTGPEYVEVTDELIARCRTNIDPNIKPAEVVKRLEDNGYSDLTIIVKDANEKFIHWTLTSYICTGGDCDADISELAIPLDEIIRILSYDHIYNCAVSK